MSFEEPSDDSSGRPRTAAVLILTWQRADELRKALRGVAAQTRQPDEVLVVVRPDDEAAHAVLAEPWELPLRTVLVHQPGVVAARNAGWAAATSDVVAFLDDDAVPEPDWLERMLAHYDDPEVAAVGGRDRVFHNGVPADEGPWKHVGVLMWYGRLAGLHHRGTGPARDVDFLKGVNMSIRRSLVPDIRVDTSLRGVGAQVYEETTLVLQVKQRGHRVIYDPAIQVDHFEADRGALDARQPRELRPRRDRQHNQTYVVTRYYSPHRAAVHFLFSLLVGTSDAPGLLLTARNILRTRTLRGHAVPLMANASGRFLGVLTAVRARWVHPARR